MQLTTVVLHGHAPIEACHPLVGELAGSMPTWSPRLPGYGTPRPHGHGHEATLKLLEGVLAGERVNLVGHSYGSYLAMNLAIRGQVAIERLVLLSPLAGFEADDLAALAGFADALRKGVDLSEVAVTRWFASATIEARHDELLRQVGDWLDKSRVGLEADLDDARNCPDLHARLSSITVPTLVIVGAVDASTPVEWAQRVAAEIPNSELEVLQHAAHFPFVEQPVECAKLILDFVGASGDVLR